MLNGFIIALGSFRFDRKSFYGIRRYDGKPILRKPKQPGMIPRPSLLPTQQRFEVRIHGRGRSKIQPRQFRYKLRSLLA